jgi:aminoglycoside phosphotransferase (APT) family kinase protein
MLGPREVVPYLQARGYLTTSGTVLDGIAIEDASRRNSNLKVFRPRGMSYFLKQARDADGAAQLAREASIYQLLGANVRRDSFGRCLPRFLGYDPNKHILVLELIRKSHNLREYHDLKRRFPAALGAALAHALAGLHRLPIKDDPVLRSSHPPPWIFSLHRPSLRHWRSLSRTSLKVVEIIQGSSEFCRLLDNLQQDWRNDTFIHFDVRWDNCIVLEPTAPDYTRGLRIIDWELAGLGDACWDVGSVLADYLSHWRSSLPLLDETAPANVKAQYRLVRMQPAMRAFWKTYVKCMQHEPAVANDLLVRSVRLGAVRLLQIAAERAQFLPEITSNIVGNVQLSLNILQRPIEAIVHLFGIRLSTSSR